MEFFSDREVVWYYLVSIFNTIKRISYLIR